MNIPGKPSWEASAAREGMVLIGFVLLALSIVGFDEAGADPDTLSLYGTSRMAWISLIAALAIAATFLSQQFSPGPLLLAIAAAGVTFAAPYIMGAAQSNSSDPVTHTAYLADYLSTGKLSDLTYALPYTVLGSIANLSGFSSAAVIKGAPFGVKLVGILSCTYLASTLLHPRLLPAVVAWTIPFSAGMYEGGFYPEIAAVLLVPAAIASTQDDNFGKGAGSVAIFLLLAFAVLFTHPRVAEICFVLLGLLLLTGWTKWRRRLAAGSFILAVTFVAWILALGPTAGVIRRIATLLTSFSLSGNVDQALSVNRDSLLRFLVLDLGTLLLLATVGAYGWSKTIRRAVPVQRRLLYAVAGAVLLGTASSLIVGFQSLTRAAHASILLGLLPVLCGAAYGSVRGKGKILLSLVLIAAVALSALTIYRSPLMAQPSWHLSDEEIASAAWVVENGEAIGGGNLYLAGLPAQTLLLPEGAAAITEGALERQYYGLLYSNYALFPPTVPPEKWQIDISHYVVTARMLSICESDWLRDSIVVGVPAAHRPDSCLLLPPIGRLATLPIVYDNGAVQVYVNVDESPRTRSQIGA